MIPGELAAEVVGVSKSFGSVRALDDVSIPIPSGRTTALLGPSGCGKTTLLRIIAGFENPDAGRVVLDGTTVAGDGVKTLRADRRSIGYVAQEGALFPHLTVRGNIEFGLSRLERRARARVSELLAMVDLAPELLQRFPHQLSGGQQQRVALVRALARRPALVLLDEPFAALDAGLRMQTRLLMTAALTATATTTILVTHDQAEALAAADQLVVLRDGRVGQVGTPDEVYRRPADPWIAGFVGDAVLLDAVADGRSAGCALGPVALAEPGSGPVTVMVRPEQLRITDHGVPARITSIDFHGHDSVIGAVIGSTLISLRVVGRPDHRVGDEIGIRVDGCAQAYR